MTVTRENIIEAFIWGTGSKDAASFMADDLGLSLTQLVDAVVIYREKLGQMESQAQPYDKFETQS